MLKRKIGLITLLATMAGGSLHAAGTLNPYTPGDVLICFRNPGTGLDMVVNAGAYTTLTSLSPNQRYTISAYDGSQLAQVGTNGTSWSAFTWLGDNTLFVTRPRSSINVQSAAWLNNSSDSQAGTAIRMNSVIRGVNNNLYSSGFDTAAVQIEEDNSVSNPNYPVGASYRDAIFGSGSQANFYTTFQGVPENSTPGNFTSAGKVQRSDFYRLDPTGTGNATWLGYFELSTNGMMTYVAYPSTTPVFKSFSRAGTASTIGYKAGLYGTYTLRATNIANMNAPVTNWPAISILTSGDTTTHTTTDTSSDLNRVYKITAQ